MALHAADGHRFILLFVRILLVGHLVVAQRVFFYRILQNHYVLLLAGPHFVPVVAPRVLAGGYLWVSAGALFAVPLINRAHLLVLLLDGLLQPEHFLEVPVHVVD